MPSTTSLETLAYVGLVLSLAWLIAGWSKGLRYGVALPIVFIDLAAVGALAFRPAPAPERTDQGPLVDAGERYLGSGACQSCHPAAYHSWRESYHRSMTQRVDKQTMRAPWHGTRLKIGDRSISLWEDADEFWALVPKPGAKRSDSPLVKRRVLMSTGSHHYQGYWVGGERGNELFQLPFVYHFESSSFLARRDVFIQPPSAPHSSPRWNSSCVMCHSVAGQPQHDLESDTFRTRTVELGIACEACHGPGRAHADSHRSPRSRYEAHFSSDRDPLIENPKQLSPEQSSSICGQCHAYFVPVSAEVWWKRGFSDYEAGTPLELSRTLLEYGNAAHQRLVNADLGSIFYRDGTVRVGGREYNALLKAPCYEKGTGTRQLGCLSCHQMHGSEPDDQLADGMRTNAACSQCHAELSANVSAHSRHSADSPGSLCYNCHMPHTSYALLKAIRSHRITSPNLRESLDAGRPNACNLCHLDRSRTWTAETLHRWYQHPPSTPMPHEDLPTGAALLLAGDAATRAIVAWHMGEEELHAFTTTSWLNPLLAKAQQDPYAAVRFIARRSAARLTSKKPELGILPLDSGTIERLIASRDNRPITISE